VRAAVEQRDAETLRGADDHVGPELTRRLEQGEREQVGCHHELAAPGSGVLGQLARVEDPARGAGVLQQHAAQLAGRHAVSQVCHDHLDAHRLGAGADHLDGLGQRVAVDDEGTGRLTVRAAYERHRLGDGCALVEEAGVGGRQPGQVADHGLEVDQCLEPALGDLRLVGGVRRVPARVLQDVAADHRRRDRRVVAEPDHRLARVVLRRDLAQLPGHGGLGLPGRQVQLSGGTDPARHRGVHQGVERGKTQGLEHRVDVLGTQADVPVDEGQSGIELGERRMV
jgi:hypothetical protein